jgi:hypothetical protein
MWVPLAECPLALGHSTFVTHSSAREKWIFTARSVENSEVLFWENKCGAGQCFQGVVLKKYKNEMAKGKR